MKKTILLILMLLGLIACCCSIPAFLQNNRIDLTPEQKAAFEQKVRERPDSLSFNPLQVGNKWWYRVEGEGNPVFVGREVVDSMSINNHLYFRVTGFGAGSNYWIRNVGDSVLVYDQYDADNNPNTLELVNEDFTIVNQTMVYHNFSNFGNGPWQCLLFDEGYLSVYGIPAYLKWYQYYYPGQHVSLTLIQWARGFGLMSLNIEDNFIYAVACRINNIMYGDTSVLNNDSVTEAGIGLTCYPNPFIYGVDIKYELPRGTNEGILEIVNVKGQRIKSNQLLGSGNIFWNGTDANGKSVSSGVYFYKLTTPERVITKKMIMLK